jgi:hypothetical protein
MGRHDGTLTGYHGSRNGKKKCNGKVRSNIGRYELVIRLCKGIQRNLGENQWVDICSMRRRLRKKQEMLQFKHVN